MDNFRPLFLIPCCKSKSNLTQFGSWEDIRKDVKNNNFSILDDYRKQIIKYMAEKPIVELEKCPVNKDIPNCGTLMAIDRYIGLMYSKIDNDLKRQIRNREIDNIWIVSALMGLILPTDLIPNYELRMQDKGPNEAFIYDYWNTAFCNREVKQLLTNQLKQFSSIYCLLSNTTGYAYSVKNLLNGHDAYLIKSKSIGMDNIFSDWANILNDDYLSNPDTTQAINDIVMKNNCELIPMNNNLNKNKEKEMTSLKVIKHDEINRIENNSGKKSDEIRNTINEEIIKPAREKGIKNITITVKDIVELCKYPNRAPNINSVLRGSKLQELCKIKVIGTEGNTSSNKGEYRYEILNSNSAESSEVSTELSIIYCNKCGKENPKDANYCSKCGCKLTF